MQICAAQPWPRPVEWLSKLKQAHKDLHILELDNFSDSQLVAMAKTYVEEAGRLVVIIEFENVEAKLNGLLSLLQFVSRLDTPKKFFLKGEAGSVPALQLTSLQISTDRFDVSAISSFLSVD